VEEDVYTNCSDIEPVKFTSKYQDSVNTENKIVNISPNVGASDIYSDNFSFKELFNSKYQTIMWIIIIIISVIVFITNKKKSLLFEFT
jgi:hypothetical protein